MSLPLPEAHPGITVRALRAGGLFVLVLLASHFLPTLTMMISGRILGNLLFFFPQIAFPYDALTLDVPHSQIAQQPIFGETAALLLELLQWGLITVAFTWLTRKVRPALLLPLAFVVIIATSFLAQWGFHLAGLTISLDGL